MLAHALQIPGMVVSFVPLAVPPLPLLPVAGILVAALPAFVVPARRAGPGVTAATSSKRWWPRDPLRPASPSLPGVHRADPRPASLEVPEGSCAWWSARPGPGKTTLLRCVNGLVPHFSGGTLGGTVTVDGRSTREHRPRDLADVVGFVGQNPLASFVTERVEDELAYTMENLGVAARGDAPAGGGHARSPGAPGAARPVVACPLRRSTAAGGHRGRAHRFPRVLVLDEPTSALDPAAAEEVLNALARLVHDLGLTVVMAEHRLERVLPFADRLVLVPGGGRPLEVGPPETVMRSAPVAPPLVELGRALGWDPLPLTVRDARRLAP